MQKYLSTWKCIKCKYQKNLMACSPSLETSSVGPEITWFSCFFEGSEYLLVLWANKTTYWEVFEELFMHKRKFSPLVTEVFHCMGVYYTFFSRLRQTFHLKYFFPNAEPTLLLTFTILKPDYFLHTFNRQSSIQNLKPSKWVQNLNNHDRVPLSGAIKLHHKLPIFPRLDACLLLFLFPQSNSTAVQILIQLLKN